MQPRNAIDVLKEAFRIYSHHASVVVGASLLLLGTQVIVSLLLLSQFGPGAYWMTTVVSMLIAQLMIGTYTLLLMHLRAGHERPTIGYLIKATLPFTHSLFWLAILVTIGVGAGTILLLIPGIYVAVRWSVAAPALIGRRAGAIDAMKASWGLTADAQGAAFVIVLFQGVIGQSVPLISAQFAPRQALEDVILVQGFVSALAAPLAALALAELFLRLTGYAPAGTPGVSAAPTPAPLGLATAGGQYEAGAWVPTARLQAAQTAAPQQTPAPHAPRQPHGTPPPPSQPHVVARPLPPTGPGSSAMPPPGQPHVVPPHPARPGHPAPPATPPARTQSVPPPGMS